MKVIISTDGLQQQQAEVLCVLRQYTLLTQQSANDAKYCILCACRHARDQNFESGIQLVIPVNNFICYVFIKLPHFNNLCKNHF